MNGRRNFLRIAGVGITGSLIKPVSSSAAKLSVGKNAVKIGVLLPQSNEHPMYPGSFLNGLRLGLNQRNAIKKNKIELITEHVNYGTPFVTKGKIQQLITENNVNILVGLLNPEVAVDIGTLVKNAKVPALISNAGENFPNKEVRENPFLFLNSLNLFQNAFMAGKHAVKKFGKNIAIVTAFFDSGYDALYTFRLGVEAAGGNITETYVKKQGATGFVDSTLTQLEKNSPDGLYVYLNGNLADEFFMSKRQRGNNIPTITTSFVLEDERLVHLGSAANNLLNFSTWSSKLENQENKLFISDYVKQYSKTPNQFAYLGYESGLILYNALTNCNSDFSGNTLVEAMNGCQLKSPAGDIFINKKTGLVDNPVYLCKTKIQTNFYPENNVLEKFKPESESSGVFETFDTAIHSGWLNPYPFV